MQSLRFPSATPEGLKGFWTSLPKVDDGLGTEDRALAFLFAVLGMQWMEPPENWLSEKDEVTIGKREVRRPLHKNYVSGPLVNGAWNYGTSSGRGPPPAPAPARSSRARSRARRERQMSPSATSCRCPGR